MQQHDLLEPASENPVSSTVSLPDSGVDLDRGYKPFPSFSTFCEMVRRTSSTWDEYAEKLRAVGSNQPELLERARSIAVRAAAVDTGALEGLYETDRGFTFSVATETTTLEAATSVKGSEVRNLISAQLSAYEYIIDTATKSVPLNETWIRTLHEVICASQTTYRVVTAAGPQDQSLPKGEYKRLPNHVRQADGSFHSWAPVLMTRPEMARLVKELNRPEFDSAHPMLQAAYAHYAFVVVHPFADGNGRVARALASVFTYRANSIPLLIMMDHRHRYLDALQAADSGAFQDFVDFIESRGIDALLLVTENLRTAAAPSSATAAARLARLYIARRGLTHAELDQLGINILASFAGELDSHLEPYRGSYLEAVSGIEQRDPGSWPNGYRPPVSGPQAVRLFLRSPAPAAVKYVRHYHIALPKAGISRDEIILWCQQTGDQIPIPIADVSPTVTSSVQYRLSIAAERVAAEVVNQVLDQAATILAQSGY